MKKYYIHNNGGSIFTVIIDNSNVIVNLTDKTKNKQLLKLNKVKHVFVGRDDMSKHHGNTILVNYKENIYYFIGSIEIYKFETKNDTIIKLISPSSHNDVSYPVAIGKENYYFMLDKRYVPKTMIKLKTKSLTDLYGYYYGHIGAQGNLEKKSKKFYKNKNIIKFIS